MDDEKYLLPIPGKIKLRMELINGYGTKELTETIIMGIISAVVSFILFKITNNYLIAIGNFALITGGTFVATIKGSNNISMIDLTKSLIKFTKSQKYYKFVKGGK